MVEPAAVNRVVVGSSPTRGARFFRPASAGLFVMHEMNPTPSLFCYAGVEPPLVQSEVRQYMNMAIARIE